MKTTSKIFVAGHNGLVGSAVLRILKKNHKYQVIFANRSELDLTDLESCEEFFKKIKPDMVILAAAKVGGILANINHPVDYLLENLKIQNNVISTAAKYEVERLIFVASSCIYPVSSIIPIKENQLLTGPLEETNKYYAIAKIAGIHLCSAYNTEYKTHFTAILPTNLYGPGDNYNLLNGHVLPSLIRKFHEAKFQDLAEVEVWGSGEVYREFLHVDDLAYAIELLLLSNDRTYDLYNVGFGTDIKIRELSKIIKSVVGFKGNIKFNKNMPDGVYRKLLDSSRIRKLGWEPKIDIVNGIKILYSDYLVNHSLYRD